MTKMAISSNDLSWKVLEMLTNSDDACPRGVALAIIPDGRSWRVVIEQASRRSMGPKCMQRLAAIERRLRSLYTLTDG